MKNLSPELKVGIFAIVVIAILSYMTLKVDGLPFMRGKGYRLYTVIDNVSGLGEKSHIKIAGVESGIVEKIRLKDGKAEVMLLVEPDVKIHRDAKVFLRMTGLLGDKYLALTTGSLDEPLLKDGDIIMDVEPVVDIDTLAMELTSVAGYMTDLAEIFRDMLGESGKRDVTETIYNLKSITKNLDDILKENKEALHRVVVSLEDFSEALGDKGPGFLDDMSKVAKDLGDKGPVLINDLSRAARDLREVIDENRYAFKRSMENINSLSESADSIVQKIDRGEGTLGKLLKDDKLYESLSKVAEEADKSLDVVGKLRTFMNFRSEYNAGENEWKGYFDLTLQPKKDKYYILGVVTDPKGSVETTDTTINGVATRQEKIESKIEFTAQFAKRFEDLALRTGMIESTFGFGADYFFNSDRGMIRVDMWDFYINEAGAEMPHVKVGVDYSFFRYIFISGGVDNILNENRRGIYIGGGVRFEDEDFKYIFGKSPDISLQ